MHPSLGRELFGHAEVPGETRVLDGGGGLGCDGAQPGEVARREEHAAAMGAYARHCDSLSDLEQAMAWAQTTDRTTVLTIRTDAYKWTPGGADWYVGVPEVSERESVQEARTAQEEFRKKQRQGI